MMVMLSFPLLAHIHNYNTYIHSYKTYAFCGHAFLPTPLLLNHLYLWPHTHQCNRHWQGFCDHTFISPTCEAPFIAPYTHLHVCNQRDMNRCILWPLFSFPPYSHIFIYFPIHTYLSNQCDIIQHVSFEQASLLPRITKPCIEKWR